jgi:RNA methyltransferase, TrmH family
MPALEVLSSPSNPLIKDVRRALLDGVLTRDGYCAVEGPHLVEEAIRSGCAIGTVMVTEGAPAWLRGTGIRIVTLAEPLFRKISAVESSQGVLALVRPPVWTMDEVFAGTALVAVLDQVRDPGNAGTIARAAEAFGASGLLLLAGSVSPFNGKVLRASAGSLFRLPFLHAVSQADAVGALRQRGVDVFAAVPAGEKAQKPTQVDLRRPCALVIGSEARGVGAALRAQAKPVTIPTVGVESLNAALAAAILLYEARRQRTPG